MEATEELSPGNATLILSVVAVATQVLVVGAVLLAVFAALEQKRQALGVLRALGAPRAYVFLSVWSHVVIMVVLGSVVGLILRWGVAEAISGIVNTETGLAPPLAITVRELVLIGSLIAAGMVPAVIPSVSVYRQAVAQALKG